MGLRQAAALHPDPAREDRAGRRRRARPGVDAVDRIGAQESVFFSERFLAARPLLESIRSEEPSGPADRRGRPRRRGAGGRAAGDARRVPGVGARGRHVHHEDPAVRDPHRRTTPATSPPRSKRRCLHLFLDYPSAERELEIVRSKDTGLPDALATQLVDIVRGLRELELRKSPSISETIDWARTLAVLGVQELTATVLVGHRVGGGQVRQGRAQGDRRAAAAGGPQRRRPGARSRARPRPRPRARALP